LIQTLKNKLKPLLRPAYHAIKKLAKKGSQSHVVKADKLMFYFGARANTWPGMGRELYNNEPVFKQIIQQCNTIFVSIGAIEIISYFEGPIIEDFFEFEKKLYLFVCHTNSHI